eukprot:366326-Chlamydomonas_euryale.AAC.10
MDLGYTNVRIASACFICGGSGTKVWKLACYITALRCCWEVLPTWQPGWDNAEYRGGMLQRLGSGPNAEQACCQERNAQGLPGFRPPRHACGHSNLTFIHLTKRRGMQVGGSVDDAHVLSEGPADHAVCVPRSVATGAHPSRCVYCTQYMSYDEQHKKTYHTANMLSADYVRGYMQDFAYLAHVRPRPRRVLTTRTHTCTRRVLTCFHTSDCVHTTGCVHTTDCSMRSANAPVVDASDVTVKACPPPPPRTHTHAPPPRTLNPQT